MSALTSIPPRSFDQATRLRHLIETGGEIELTLPIRSTKRAKIITISSGKGGVGKTNLAVNLAIALQARGIRTTLLDLDLGLANADLLCGLNPAARLDRASANETPLEDLAILAPGGFRLIPGSVGLARVSSRSGGVGGTESDPAPLLTRIQDGELDACSDVLILDTGAGMGPAVRAALRAADLALLVANPEPTSLADAYALLKVACTTNPAQFLPMLVLNQCATAQEAQEVHTRITAVANRFLCRDLPLLAAIPNDPALPQAVRDRRPLILNAPESPATLAITAAADAVISRLNLTPPTLASAAQTTPPTTLWQRLTRLVSARVD